MTEPWLDDARRRHVEQLTENLPVWEAAMRSILDNPKARPRDRVQAKAQLAWIKQEQDDLPRRRRLVGLPDLPHERTTTP